MKNNMEMTAVVLEEFGGLDKLKTKTRPIPEVGPDEIVIHVETAGVGVRDPLERQGGLGKRGGARGFAVASGPYGLTLAKEVGAGSVVDRHKDDVYMAGRSLVPEGGGAAVVTAGGKEVDKAISAV